MENATNGLLMAGSVLIGIIVISLFVYLFTTMGGVTKNFQEELDLTSVQKFNEQFEKYIGKEDLSSHDMLTLYNLVEAINNEAGEKVVEVKGVNQSDIKNLTAFLTNGKIYKNLIDKVKYDEETGKISYLEFKEI